MTEWSGDTVCGLLHARGDEERGFLGFASKPRSMVWPQNHWDEFPDLSFKTDSYGLVI
jgi:hypothetical protein